MFRGRRRIDFEGERTGRGGRSRGDRNVDLSGLIRLGVLARSAQLLILKRSRGG